jgi:glutamate dehydrogenase/leucine dehydrogenase
MDLIRETTPFVAGTATSRGGSGDPSFATAFGVVVAMEAAAARLWGDGLKGRTVCVLGTGKVGGEVIRLLVQRQVVVIASDVDRTKAERALRLGAARLVEPSHALNVTADILCPCALGGLLTDEVVPDLSFRIIVGAANNQLAQAEVADSLSAAGILYVPDFLANAGGIINIAEESHGYDQARAVEAVGEIRGTTIAVLTRAELCGITPLAAAEELVDKRLASATGSVDGAD